MKIAPACTSVMLDSVGLVAWACPIPPVASLLDDCGSWGCRHSTTFDENQASPSMAKVVQIYQLCLEFQQILCEVRA